MSRPLRIELPNALYHVTARGDRREDIFEDDADRQMFLSTLEQVITPFNCLCHAWCLMDKHYHLMIQTPDGNLSKCMRQLNGVYTQVSKRRSLAQQRYAQFVSEGINSNSPLDRSCFVGARFIGRRLFIPANCRLFWYVFYDSWKNCQGWQGAREV